jgi:hypothetical protein
MSSYFRKKGEFLGRLMLHEFGHGFAKLGDEYYNLIHVDGLPSFAESLMSSAQSAANPNCKATLAEAQSAWGDLVVPDRTTGYFYSCGGDCPETCASFVRSTFNAVMKHNSLSCDLSTGNCTTGPPFDPWGAVASREILKHLANYK